MSKHTPGPWYAKQGCIYSRAHEINYSLNPKNAPYIWRVASLINGKTPEEIEANEALIAAAPELLAALQAAEEALLQHNGNAQVIAQVRAAIAKATTP